MPALPHRTNLPLIFRHPGRFAQMYWLTLSILLVGVIADAVTTWQNAMLLGPSIETHIVQRWVQQALGPSVGVPVAKLIQLGFVLLVAAWWKPWTPWLMAICGVFYSLAALSNHFLWL